MSEQNGERRLLGYLCPKAPDGPMIPPQCLYDPCGGDVAVYSDGTTDPPRFGARSHLAARPSDEGSER